MADRITDPEKALLRADGHKVGVYLSVLAPDSILVARLNNGSAARGDRSIVYDGGSGSSAEHARIQAGQPLWVGTAAGLHDRGITRIKSFTGDETSGTLEVAENASVGWTDDDYLTIKEEYPLFPKFPRFWIEGSGDDQVNYWRKDYDTAYTDENEEPPPVAIMGPHRAGFLSGGTVRFYLDSSESYAVAPAATIDGTSWTATGGGATTIDSAASAATHLDITAAGYYWVSCTVTDSNAKTTKTRRCFFVHNATVGHADYPHVDIEITTFNGNWNRGGWNIALNVRDNGSLTDIPDKTLIVLWQDATYGSTNQDIGGWKLNNADARHVLFAGYVRGDTVLRDWATSRVKFQVSSITGLMQKTPADGVFIGTLVGGQTGDWPEYLNLTFTRALHHLFAYHSTLLDIADVYMPDNSLYRLHDCEEFTGGTLYNQAANFIRNFSIYGGLCANKAGQIHIERNINSINATDRNNIQAVSDIGETDRRDRPDLTILRQEEAKVFSVTTSGFSWDGTNKIAYISNAPGTVKNDEGRGVRNLERQIFADQDVANSLAGRIMAIENNDIREVRVPFKGHYLGVLDIVPQEWWRMSLSSGDTERGITLSNRKMVPRTVTAKFDIANGTIKADAILEPEAAGVDGLTSDYPSGPPDTPPPDPPPPEPPPGTGDGNTVYVQVENAIGRTLNFLDASPDWLNVPINTNKTGVIYRLIIDPWVVSASGTTAVWLATQSGAWMTKDMNRRTPKWKQKLTAAQFATATGKTLSAVRNIKATIAEQNRFYIHALDTEDTLYVGMTANGGDTWTFTSVGTVTDTEVALGFAVSQHNALKVWSCGADGVLKGSVDGAASFSTLYTIVGATGPINAIEVPYASNPTDQIIYISYVRGSVVPPRSWPFTADEEGWVHDDFPILSYWGSSRLNLDAVSGWNGGWWRYYPSAGSVIAATGATFSGSYYWPGNCFWGLRIVYTDESFNLVSGQIGGKPSRKTVTVSAPNDGKTVLYFAWEVSHHSGSPPTWFDDAAIVGFTMDLGPVLEKSTDGGGSFSDVTPSEGGSSAFCSMEVATLDGQTIYALVRDDDTEEHHSVVSDDGAGSWTEQSDFNSIAPADADGQASLGAWPSDSSILYCLQHRDPGGTPADMIVYSTDQMATWANKVGDWSSAIGSTWGLVKAYAGSITPVWLN